MLPDPSFFNCNGATLLGFGLIGLAFAIKFKQWLDNRNQDH